MSWCCTSSNRRSATASAFALRAESWRSNASSTSIRATAPGRCSPRSALGKGSDDRGRDVPCAVEMELHQGMGAQILAFAQRVHDCEMRSEEHTSELQSLMRISYAVFCLKKKTQTAHIIILLT